MILDKNIAYTKATKKPFAEVVIAIQEIASRNGFRTLHVHDVDKTIAEKGFHIEPYSIIEVCNAAFAHQVLTKYKPVGMMLPCRIVVYAEGSSNMVMLMKPTLLSTMMPEADLGTVPYDVGNILITVIDQALQ